MKTIRVSEEIHTKLSHLGLKSETYNDIIGRLISFYEEEFFEEFRDEDVEYYMRGLDNLKMEIMKEQEKLI